MIQLYVTFLFLHVNSGCLNNYIYERKSHWKSAENLWQTQAEIRPNFHGTLKQWELHIEFTEKLEKDIKCWDAEATQSTKGKTKIVLKPKDYYSNHYTGKPISYFVWFNKFSNNSQLKCVEFCGTIIETNVKTSCSKVNTTILPTTTSKGMTTSQTSDKQCLNNFELIHTSEWLEGGLWKTNDQIKSTFNGDLKEWRIRIEFNSKLVKNIMVWNANATGDTKGTSTILLKPKYYNKIMRVGTSISYFVWFQKEQGRNHLKCVEFCGTRLDTQKELCTFETTTTTSSAATTKPSTTSTTTSNSTLPSTTIKPSTTSTTTSNSTLPSTTIKPSTTSTTTSNSTFPSATTKPSTTSTTTSNSTFPSATTKPSTTSTTTSNSNLSSTTIKPSTTSTTTSNSTLPSTTIKPSTTSTTTSDSTLSSTTIKPSTTSTTTSNSTLPSTTIKPSTTSTTTSDSTLSSTTIKPSTTSTTTSNSTLPSTTIKPSTTSTTTSDSTLPSTTTIPSTTSTTTSTTATTQTPTPADDCKLKYNYTEVIEKSLLFYEAQRSGKLPSDQRVKWRKDSTMKDGSEVNTNLTGGYFNDGGYVKFGFPLAFSITNLAWGMIEFKEGYKHAGQYKHAIEAIKWGTDYFLKCHSSSSKLYGQVGDSDIDNSWWGRPEDMALIRPVYSIDEDRPGSDLAAEIVAALAASSLLFRNEGNLGYALDLLTQAKQLYSFACKYRGTYTKAIPDADSLYKSKNGFIDELAWASLWLFKVTDEKHYKDKFMKEFDELAWDKEAGEYSWNNKWLGVKVLAAQMKMTGKDYLEPFKSLLQQPNQTPKGLFYVEKSGSNRHAANLAFLARVASRISDGKIYNDFARSQIHYMLGDTGRSFVVGFGKDPPQRPYHRSSSCPTFGPCGWIDLYKEDPNPQVLYGALVGGPDDLDQYEDVRSDTVKNKVALDYNAGFQSAVAGLLQLSLQESKNC